MLRALTFALANPCVRWPRQDDGAASGCRGIFVWVKPDKHSPVLRDGVEVALPIAGCRQMRTKIGLSP
jgi:hypothetical protein